MAAPRMLIVIAAATALVVAAVVLLLTRSWLALGVVMAMHAIATAIVIAYAFKRAAEDDDKPDPVAEADIEEERAQARPGARPHPRY